MKARQQKVFQIERFEKVVNILIVEHLLCKDVGNNYNFAKE